MPVKSSLSADDLYRFRTITDCQISPDGRHVIMALQRVDRKSEKRFSNLWLVPAGGGRPRQFTYGDQMDTTPRWSPDGSQIAFLSNRQEDWQVYLIDFGGGEARPLTRLQGEIRSLSWSPDGRYLLCQFRRKDAEAEEGDKPGIVARHITRLFFKEDGAGYLPRERWHIWTIDARTGRARQLTAGGRYVEGSPAGSADAQEILFLSNRSPDPDLDPEAVDLFVMPAKGGEPRKIETFVGGKSNPSFSPDGRWIAFTGREGRGQWWKNTDLWVVPADGGAEPRNLTAPYDFTASSVTINDIHGFMPETAPVWSKDGESLFFQGSWQGSTLIYSVGLDGGLEIVVEGPGVAGMFSLDREQARMAYLRAGMTDPGQVWVRDMAAGRSRRLTRFNLNLLRARDLGEVEEVRIEGRDGYPIHGWIIKPPGFDPSRTYPAIIEIHGGPRTQYGHFFMHEFFFLAGQGYVVAFCNPRGSQGYGAEHSRAIENNWGTVDYVDVMAWTDFVAALPYVDEQRMGVTGGSYGGYMTNWIIGHTDRFRAAVTQRSVSNLVSMYGTSDLNWVFQREFGDSPPWENVENYWRQSPIKYIGNARTPTLVIHSEKDMRCAPEQGEQVFVALKKLGVETELVLFPDEPHGLSRGGRTDRRIERLNHILRWFDRYLK